MAIETWCCGGRHIQLLLLVLCVIIEQGLQQAFRVSIYLVQVKNPNNVTLFDDPFRQVIESWNNEQKAIVTNSRIVLVFLSSAVSGFLTLKINLKWFLLVIMAALTCIVYVSPQITVYGDFDYVLATVIVMSFLHGLIDPVLVALLARWTPRTELGRTVPLAFTVNFIAESCMFLLYNFLERAAASWVSLFYLMGNTGILWCVAWFTFGSQNPDRCFYVSLREKNFILSNMMVSSLHKKLSIPWSMILKSPQFYGVLLAHICFQWMYRLMFNTGFFQSFAFSQGVGYTFSTYIGYFSALFLIPFVQIGVGLVGDLIVKRSKYPARYVRKTFNSIAFWGGSVFLLLCCYDGTSLLFDIVVASCFGQLSSAAYQGVHLTYFDMDRAYSGFIYGLVQFFALIPLAYVNSIFPAFMKTLAVASPELNDRFDIIWFSGSYLLFFGNFFYVIMADDESRPIIPCSSN
ncbi:Major Facilitator Superfamily [Nesidiocoris tenuis]|uniref:Major Facilitator Superfamily n=1 Tax=Nesidiocoris tenuis TaxID=355587 RepID=A0ABN7ATN9_9HEMI|nr:Major Facilitator Superfamily [Nesidiocoris tenuis]